MPISEVESALEAGTNLRAEALLSLAEDQSFDRKSIRISARSLADALIGLGNADGGYVAVGFRDGVFEGTDSEPDHRNDLQQAAIDFSDPPVRVTSRLVECQDADGRLDHALILEVQPGDSVHANVKDDVYLRVGDENRRLSFAQRRELHFDRGQAAFEAEPVAGATFEDLDADLARSYADHVGAADVPGLFRARGLASAEQLTIAGSLLFARRPQQFLPGAVIRVLRYRGRSRGTGSRRQAVLDERLDGPVPSQLLRAQALVKEIEPTRRALTEAGRFGDVSLIPSDAWLEGIVNAAVHRSYSLQGDYIRIEVFDDRIEISSPGRFPGVVSLTDPLGAPHFARNPRIARVCAELAFGQEIGEGIRRMFEEMRQAGLGDPTYSQTAASTQLTLSAELVDRELEARLPAETRLIVGALREAERLSTGEIVDLLGMGRPATIRRLTALRDAGLVEWVGKSARDPRAYWRLPPT